MTVPTLQLMPIRPAVRKATETRLDVLIRLTPAPLAERPRRPPLNLALVLDRSGSMSQGKKMPHAIAAAVFVVEQLLPTDRVSVTVFDEQIETIVPNQVAANKSGIAARIRAVSPRGSTALHGGWAEGAQQVEKNLAGAGLNRVLLLSDGQANVGLSAPDAVATEVCRLKDRRVSTTTLGVGDDYNEDLMQAMARSGDGNYYFIEDPRQLADLFQTELSGLIATQGTGVSLRLEPQNGVDVVEVLNDLPRGDDGALHLSNLIAGMPQDVVVRLSIPPRDGVTEVLRARVEWVPSGPSTTHTSAASLILPAVDDAEFDALKDDPEVYERVALQRLGRIKERAYRAAEQGQFALTRACIDNMQELLGAMPASASVLRETDDVALLKTDLDSEEMMRLIKRSKFQQYARSTSRPPVPPGEPKQGGS